MKEEELIERLKGRLFSLSDRISEEKDVHNFYSWDMELESITNEILVIIRRSFEESDAYIQKLNKISPKLQFYGFDPEFLYYDRINQLNTLLDTLKRELEVYGRKSNAETQPTLIVMNPGSKLALRDYIDHPVTINNYLTALMQDVEESDIPEPAKVTLMQQLKDLATNPYVSGSITGLSTSLLGTYLWKAMGLG
jgi:predicted permease